MRISAGLGMRLLVTVEFPRFCRSITLAAACSCIGHVGAVLVASLGVVAASEPLDRPGAKAALTAPLFETSVLPILQAKCVRCHGGEVRKADLDLRTAASLLAGGESGAVVEPQKPTESLLFERILDGSMPPDAEDADRLSEAQIEQIRGWIAAGAVSQRSLSADSGGGSPEENSFHAVLPILLRHCTVCHGPRVHEADLDLHTYAQFMRGGKSGPIVQAGDPERSLIVQRIAAHEMPPIDRLIEVSVKQVDVSELETIRSWIAAGAREGDVVADTAGNESDLLVTDQDRDFWSFRAPVRAVPPVVTGVDPVRNAVDAFVLAQLESRRLSFAAPADRATLLRRVCFDLLGIPPSPEQLASFLEDRDPLAYEKLVDQLLASPDYGERWGRVWLDVAGYADSDGKREQDLARPYAWRYRDYVIRAFNRDKPYDQFLQQQLAGDELADYSATPQLTDAHYDNLVATGFLRMAPDPTWRNVTNFIPDRLDVIADEIDILGSSVMGLTIKCARCHSHKFDPLPQRDYYRLISIFKGAFDEYDWMKSNWDSRLSEGQRIQRELPCNRPEERVPWEAAKAKVDQQLEILREVLRARTASDTQRYVEQRIAKFPSEQRSDLLAMLATPQANRSPAQLDLAKQFEAQLTISQRELRKLDAEYEKFLLDTESQMEQLEKDLPPEPTIHALWDRGDPSPTYLYRRGDFQLPGRLIGPGVPSVLTDGRTPFVVEPPWPGASSTGRRLAFARWLTHPDHPLTARVFVNRIWKHHFGAGLVRTLDNFGKVGSPPSHPELLDWLARDFVAHDWSVKRLHRLLVTSTTYRQSSMVAAEVKQLDPENVHLSRMPSQRLSADQLYDALLWVAGQLDPRRGGAPDGVELRNDGLTTPRRGSAGWRRSIYLQQQRKVVVTHLETFDFPAMNPNCSERHDSTVATQALYLWNNGMVEELAEHFADRVVELAADTPESQVEVAHRIALGRPATATELKTGVTALRDLTEAWEAYDARLVGSEPVAPAGSMPRTAVVRALSNWCHAILNSAEFLYVD
ncbi:MAG: PSD1 and planctomycete cytochrome C domain-containing protein [Planctomycetota bacterium]|nr:PSD1 and planctomycete cytochrome C domain-containing protein [Planctomycetota bacterium]